MVSEAPKNELTSTLHLNLREVTEPGKTAEKLDELLASLSQEERDVVAMIREPHSNKAMILIARGSKRGSRFLITHEGVTIGRSVESSVFLDDVTVSRKHAKISVASQGFILTDLGSLNGTYFGNALVTEVVLRSGDEFQIGKFHFVFIASQ